MLLSLPFSHLSLLSLENKIVEGGSLFESTNTMKMVVILLVHFILLLDKMSIRVLVLFFMDVLWVKMKVLVEGTEERSIIAFTI